MILVFSSTDFLALIRGYERPLQPVPEDSGYHLHAHWLVLCHPTTNKVVKYISHDLILGSVIYLCSRSRLQYIEDMLKFALDMNLFHSLRH